VRWGMAGPNTNNTETLPYPIWGFGPPSPEPDTKKLDALLASLNASAERLQTLWFSFLGLTLYLAIAASATTHRNLLLGEPQVLPILNIKVELLPFYVIAPLLYLVVHFYLLMMLALLARTAAEFDKQLRTTIAGELERERYRAQVGNALFLQLLVGMKGERTGMNALLMGLIALITIVLCAARDARPHADEVPALSRSTHHLVASRNRRRRSLLDRGDDLPMLLPPRNKEGAAGAGRPQPQAALGHGDCLLRSSDRRPRAARRLAVI
jgi:hypothetical protein